MTKYKTRKWCEKFGLYQKLKYNKDISIFQHRLSFVSHCLIVYFVINRKTITTALFSAVRLKSINCCEAVLVSTLILFKNSGARA